MIASLAMYDWPQVAAANDRLWALIRDALRAEGIAAPDGLTRDDSLWRVWESPDLVLAQTCGMPYRTRLHGQVALLGTPDYALPDAPPGHYCSELVVRADMAGDLPDFTGRIFAFNGHDSQSGWAAPQNELARRGLPPFTHTLHTRAHRESARAVADGRADIAAIDAVTWRLYRDHFPDEAARLRVLTHTAPTPGLPLITALSRPADSVQRAAAAGVAALDAGDRALLHLKGIVFIPPAEYLSVPTPPPPSQDAPSVPAD
jgi:ABC-type phosphate/phosphonate transport system substrate-binding protein